MASQASFDDLLQCSICLERFTQPKLLPCSHTFCLSCLKGIIKDAETVDCPTCRRTHQVPEQGPAGFHDNLVVRSLLDMIGDSMECADCEKKQILSECEHCKHQVCPDCRASHNRLEAEISIQIQSVQNSLTKSDESSVESARTELDKTRQTQNDVKKAFEEAVDIVVGSLNSRKDAILRKYEIFAKFQEALANREHDPVINETKENLTSYHKSADLREMKRCLSVVENMLENEDMSCPAFKCDSSELKNIVGEFGELCFGGETLKMIDSVRRGMIGAVGGGGESSHAFNSHSIKVQGQGRAAGSEVQGRGQLSRFPSGVDYAGKVDAWRLVISKAAAGCEELKPTCAVYSQTDSALYCLSAGKLLRYDHKSGAGAIVSNTVTASHLALTDSGAVMFIDGCNIVKVTADTRVKSNVDAAHYSFTNMNLNCTKPTQICCHGKEFVILDAGKKCLLKFREDGKLIGEIKSDKLVLGEKSRMCVDGEGRIYLCCGQMKVKRRNNEDYYSTCCETPKTTTVILSEVISVLSWDGEVFGEAIVEAGREVFDWRYANLTHCPKLCNDYNHLHKDRVSDEQLRCEILTKHSSPVTSLCVEGDGYLILTRAGRHQVDVYNPDHEHHVTIEGSLKEPTGVSLTPDGRIIVCDTGNNRIQII